MSTLIAVNEVLIISMLMASWARNENILPAIPASRARVPGHNPAFDHEPQDRSARDHGSRRRLAFLFQRGVARLPFVTVNYL